MKPETIKIDEVEYVRKDTLLANRSEVTGNIYIAVLQRGWIAVGYRSVTDGGDFSLSNAAHIRVWGTTKGLGEIADDGPTLKTVLDFCPTIEYNPLTAIMHIRCREAAWVGKLS